MPLYVVSFLDNPGANERRMAARDAHLAYVRGSGVMKLGGPYLDEGGAMIGSLIVIEVADMAAAEAFVAGDPYKQVGVFDEAVIRPWRHTAGQIP